MEFSQSLALALSQSKEEFPVDFDDAWKWIGWTRKSTAKQTLENNFEEGLDFCRKGCKSMNGGRPRKIIMLSVDCFKSLGMMAGTEKGREIRRYFLECERQVQEVMPAQNAELEKLRLELALSQSRERLTAAAQTLNAINPGLAALALGQPDAVVSVPEPPIYALVSADGRILETYDGLPISRLAERYGFGRGKKANNRCRDWVRSLGINDDQWVEEKGLHVTKKLPRDLLRPLDQAFQGAKGERQRLVGE